MRILLSLGIAILYPILVFFTVMTFIPSPAASQLPKYPSCSQYDNDRFGSLSVNNSCEREHEKYKKDLADYREAQKVDEGKDITRAQIALGLALLTIVGALFLRDIKELMAGFTTGAVVVVVGATSVIIGGSIETISVVNVLLVLLSFIMLTVILYLLEHSLPTGDTVKIPESTRAATPPNPGDDTDQAAQR